ncbi:hypothetical protein QAD02_018845 [Eretmocerus hayati]|uniref:Uncharacterized protein n=1 Tax=Eretmocerus hayati TaxID=131215 RepID=A0ACC2PJ35_9HYME|nr:hypothetical protein QAD02_018845 [Eretmocerus hayati]
MEENNETKLIYYIDDEQTPYLVRINVPPGKVTLADCKNVLNRPNYKYFFKSMDDDFGVVKEEIVDDDAHLPCFDGRVVSWLVTAEGSNTSDGASQCTETAPHQETKYNRNDHVTPGHTNRPPLPLSRDDTLTETDSIISSGQGRHLHRMSKHEKYNRFNGPRINGHSKHRSGLGYESASIFSSDLETTTFLESDDDASSRITSTTGRHTNMSSAVDRTIDRRRTQKRLRRRMPPMSRTSSFSSITDSTMSLNIITVSLNMDTVNFLGISIVGQSNKGGDGGIYVGSIMKGGAVALDGRIEPGDMILQVNDINFENMSNDEAVQVLREVVQKPGPIKLVVAKCWDPNPKGYFTIQRTEPVRPIDPGAWVAHTAAIRGEAFPPRPPSATTMTSTSSSLTSTLPDNERPFDDRDLSVNSDMATIVRAMARPDSGLEIRDRMWLKITIQNAFIGADVVDWLYKHVKGFHKRQDARKYASLMLKAGYIRHTVNTTNFSEQCYYTFVDLCSSMSNIKLDCDTVGIPSNTCDMPYLGSYTPHANSGCNPMLFNFSNEPTIYGYHREDSLHSGSELHIPAVPAMPKSSATTLTTSGGGSGSGNGNNSGSNGKRSNGSRSRSSGSEQSVQTDLSGSRQSFRIAMGNPCEFFVDVM